MSCWEVIYNMYLRYLRHNEWLYIFYRFSENFIHNLGNKSLYSDYIRIKSIKQTLNLLTWSHVGFYNIPILSCLESLHAWPWKKVNLKHVTATKDVKQHYLLFHNWLVFLSRPWLHLPPTMSSNLSFTFSFLSFQYLFDVIFHDIK